MLINITASACFIIVLLILLIDFYSKETIDNLDNKSFKRLAVTCIIGLLIEFFDYLFVIYGFDIHLLVMIVFGKLVFIYYIVFMYFFILYVYSTCKRIQSINKEYNTFKLVLTIIYSILGLLIAILPFNFSESTNYLYPIGLATDVSYLVGGLGVLFIMLMCVLNIKNLKQQKGMPIFWGMVGAVISMIVQFNFHELLLLIPAHAISIIIMYFTIENPDIKMLRIMELAKDEAERANHAKSDFLSSMSHEIRTPLNAIVGLSEDNLNYKDNCPKEVIENSNDIINASQTLLEIVGNILDINKIEANKMELVENPYNFIEEINNMCKVTQTRIGEKNIIFHLKMAQDIPYELVGDKGKVKEVVNNLLTNAIKYTDKGQIVLDIKCINDLSKNMTTLVISCQDTGKGIKADHINRLFTKFDRLDVEKNTTTEGTGLGLAITKALVEMMGGKINVQSQYGQGSLFVIYLPQKINKFNKPITEESLMNTQVRLAAIANTSYGNKKILIADDNKLNIKVARKAIQDFNFEIDECYDGQQCLNKVVNGNEYDLILMDIMMPNMSGETALAKLKENPNFNIPTIALTADAIAGAKEKYVSEGFIDYIAKPFSKDQIKEKLDIVFKNNKEPETITNDSETKAEEVQTDTPKYDPNVDRFKDVPAYVVGSDDDK